MFEEKFKTLNGQQRYRTYNTMADYEENVTGKMLSFLRFALFDEQLTVLVTKVGEAERVLRDRMKNSNQQDSDEDLDPQFKGENLPVISYRNEVLVHKHIA